MAGEIRTSIFLDMAGNLAVRARQFGGAIRQFSQSGSRSMTVFRRAAAEAGKGLDRLGNRYTALITGAAGVGAVRQVIGLDLRLTRLGIQANRSADEITKLKDSVFAAAQAADIRVAPDQLLDAIDGIIEKTGDLDFATANVRNIGLAIQATGASGKDIGELFAELQKIGITAPQEVLKVFDTMNVQGKEGAFTLQNLAALGPRVVQAYVSTGREGAQAMRELGATLQVVRQGTGNAEQAATSFEAVIRTFTDPAKLKLLRAGGIQVFDAEELKKGREVLRPINELMVDIIKRSQGKKTVLGQIFDSEAIRAFNAPLAEFNRTGGVASLEKFLKVQGDGTATTQDSARAAATASAALDSLLIAWKRFADANLTGPIQSAADALNSLDPETVQRWFRIGTAVAGTFGALIAGRKLFNAGQAVARIFRVPGAGGAISGGAAGALGGAGGAPVPVFVVNGSALGGVGGASGAAGAAAGTAARTGRAAGLARGAARVAGRAVGVGLAFETGREIGSIINNAIDGTSIGNAIGAAVANTLAAFGNKEAKLAIEIDARGQASVRSMRADGLEIDVDTGPLMVSP